MRRTDREKQRIKFFPLFFLLAAAVLYLHSPEEVNRKLASFFESSPDRQIASESKNVKQASPILLNPDGVIRPKEVNPNE